MSKGNYYQLVGSVGGGGEECGCQGVWGLLPER